MLYGIRMYLKRRIGLDLQEDDAESDTGRVFGFPDVNKLHDCVSCPKDCLHPVDGQEGHWGQSVGGEHDNLRQISEEHSEEEDEINDNHTEWVSVFVAREVCWPTSS